MRIVRTVVLDVPEGPSTLGDLERLVDAAVTATGRGLLEEALIDAEARARATLGGSVRRVKSRPLDLLTRFGWIRLQRQQVMDLATGRYFHPVDRLLELQPRQHVSPWVATAARDLVAATPVRRAARTMEGWLGTRVDYRTLWGWEKRRATRSPRSRRSSRATAAASAARRSSAR